MRFALKLAIVLFVMLDVAFAVFLVKEIRADVKKSADRQQELAEWIGDTERLPQEMRQALYAQMAGEALNHTYVQGECAVRDGRLNLRVSNDEESECAFSLTLVSIQTGEVLAKTDLVDPGYRVEGMEYLGSLAPGRHECLAKLEFYWIQNDAYVGGGARQVLVTVK